jgi:hypothetical protein
LQYSSSMQWMNWIAIFCLSLYAFFCPAYYNLLPSRLTAILSILGPSFLLTVCPNYRPTQPCGQPSQINRVIKGSPLHHHSSSSILKYEKKKGTAEESVNANDHADNLCRCQCPSPFQCRCRCRCQSLHHLILIGVISTRFPFIDPSSS